MAPTKKNSTAPVLPQDAYFKKTLPFEHAGARLELRVSQDLFSSFDIDVGTRFLLRTLNTSDIAGMGSILDLGCGYGPIGLTLRKLAQEAVVHMVDRDALAVEYTRQNAALNGLDDVQIYGSLGYDDVDKHDFDLIVSNIPAKAGEAAITYFLQEAAYHLNPQGQVAVVVVTSLDPLVDQILGSMPNVVLMLRRTRPGHTVYQYRFTGEGEAHPAGLPSGIERGLYRRDEIELELDTTVLTVETAYGVPEFESPTHVTEMLIEGVLGLDQTTTAHTVLFNPGQGYGAVTLWAALRPQTIDLVDRDLLALRYSRRNLIDNGCPSDTINLMHQVGFSTLPSRPADLIAGVLREDEGPAALTFMLNRMTEALAPGATVVIASSSTTISRLVPVLQAQRRFTIESRKRREGDSLLILNAQR